MAQPLDPFDSHHLSLDALDDLAFLTRQGVQGVGSTRSAFRDLLLSSDVFTLHLARESTVFSLPQANRTIDGPKPLPRQTKR